jgi:hypothetical protein
MHCRRHKYSAIIAVRVALDEVISVFRKHSLKVSLTQSFHKKLCINLKQVDKIYAYKQVATK